MSVSARLSPAPIWRRIAASLYDLLLLLALYWLAGAIMITTKKLITNTIEVDEGFNPFMFFALLSISFSFYAYFWTKSGQTLGMQAWKIKMIMQNNTKVDLKSATVRFFTMLLSFLLFGLPFLWLLFSRNKQTLHDTLSQTCTIKCI